MAKSTVKNPKTNKLKAGVTIKKINNAIRKSGYPLQHKVRSILEKKFYVQEEWSFIDDTLKEQRAIDLLATKEYYTLNPQPRVRPSLNLVIECKQSDLPFVFFLSKGPSWLSNFPLFAGLKNDFIKIITDDDKSNWNIGILSALGLEDEPFINSPLAISSIMSKGERKQDEIELTGLHTYNNIVLPIIKAMKYFKEIQTPKHTPYYFDLHMVIGVAVIDGPMIGVTIKGDSHVNKYKPWVRLKRHESKQYGDLHEREELYAIDVVHKDFLVEYLDKHLLPFTEKFGKLTIKHETELATNLGFISKMAHLNKRNYESSLIPRHINHNFKRNSDIVKALFIELPIYLYKRIILKKKHHELD